jgi:hypothetical protein
MPHKKKSSGISSAVSFRNAQFSSSMMNGLRSLIITNGLSSLISHIVNIIRMYQMIHKRDSMLNPISRYFTKISIVYQSYSQPEHKDKNTIKYCLVN